MKSFEDINILIEMQLFCLKVQKLLFTKKMFLKKKLKKKRFLEKNCDLKQKNFFLEKYIFWKKIFSTSGASKSQHIIDGT